MELLGNSICLGETAVDLKSEKTINGEIIIPDYLGDVVRIVRIECIPKITSKRTVDDSISFECNAEIMIWYWSDKEKITVLKHSESYSETIKNKAFSESVCCLTSINTEYCNGGIINSRKLSYKAVVAVSTRCYNKKFGKILLNDDINCLECKSRKISVSNLVAAAEKSITVSDIVEIASSKSDIYEVLRCDAEVFSVDVKTITNKIITRGHVDVRITYLDDKNRIENSYAELPFTQIIDIDGVDEETTPDLRYSVASVSALIKNNENGLSRQITVSADLNVVARGYKNNEYNVSDDAYSTCYNCELSTDLIETERFCGKYKSDIRDSVTFETSEKITAVNDAYAKASAIGIVKDDNGVAVKCSVECSVVVTNEANVPILLSKVFETVSNFVPDGKVEKIRVEPEVKIASVGYTITGDNNVMLKINGEVDSLLFNPQENEIIIGANIDESEKIVRKNSASLVIYYAKKGDKLFDIAKAYRTTEKSIIEANEIEETVFNEDRTIIIPIIR